MGVLMWSLHQYTAENCEYLMRTLCKLSRICTSIGVLFVNSRELMNIFEKNIANFRIFVYIRVFRLT